MERLTNRNYGEISHTGRIIPYSTHCCRCDSRMTNADRIRNMSDEELADILFDSCIDHIEVSSCERMFEKDSCKECVLEWLQSEAEQSRRKEDKQ